MTVDRAITAVFRRPSCTASGGKACATIEGNILKNPRLDIENPETQQDSTPFVATGRPTVSMDWRIYNSQFAPTTTDFVRIGPLDNERKVLHVRTEAGGNGLVQCFNTLNCEAGHLLVKRATAWVFVVKGYVMLGTVDDYKQPVATSSSNGVWERLQVGSDPTPVKEVTLYSWNGPADFYVDSIVVEKAG